MKEKVITETQVKEETNLVILSCRNLSKVGVKNLQGQDLGDIYDIAIDLKSRCIAYVVLAYSGGMGRGKKLFAIPMEAFSFDDVESLKKGTAKSVILNIPKEALVDSEGFEEKNWPSAPNYEWLKNVYTKYGFTPYWEQKKL